MKGLFFTFGLASGLGLYFLYEHYFNQVYSLGKELLTMAKGDLYKAIDHIKKLV